MFGSKLRSWMEAVRPRKKQQRKEKQKSNTASNSKTVTILKQPKSYSSGKQISDKVERKSGQTIGNHAPRYSGTNLSSPESAYSTGYSTDGTSPGAPPEYYINIRTGTKYFPSTILTKECRPSNYTSNISSYFKGNSETPNKSKISPRLNKGGKSGNRSGVTVRFSESCLSMNEDVEKCKSRPGRATVTFQNNNLNSVKGISRRVTEVVVNPAITSPRQRNRIRTNPWLPGNNLSPCTSNIGLHVRQDNVIQTLPSSPMPMHCLSLSSSPSKNPGPCHESTSSSCSSLSAGSLQWDTNLVGPNSDSEEDDCTLNEMMGKYDESYIYEKETDILSDSDPTDCETDIDTGQDGGDEAEPLEREFDFIDNGSYLEFNVKDEINTGHCTYYNFEVQRKSSKRKPSRKFKQQESQQLKQSRRKSASIKQKLKHEHKSHMITQVDGSKSAGATPVSVRKIKYPVSKLALEDNLKKRSNSVSFSRNAVNAFDQRDKEADKKYKELIVEAEHILMSMKHGGLSPRRLPGPANKRVELLRTEFTKPDIFNKNKLNEDASNIHLTKIPSIFNNSRYSPKRNHITNFINNNSPVHIRKDIERPIDVGNTSLSLRKEDSYLTPAVPNSPSIRKKYNGKSEVRRSPKYRKKLNKTLSLRRRDMSSSESENEEVPKQRLPTRNSKQNGFICPQSEPVKRKVYSHQSKTVAFNLNYESVYNLEHRNSAENLRQQVLLNTIANLKKSLEDQSASLKQVYSSQDVQP